MRGKIAVIYGCVSTRSCAYWVAAVRRGTNPGAVRGRHCRAGGTPSRTTVSRMPAFGWRRLRLCSETFLCEPQPLQKEAGLETPGALAFFGGVLEPGRLM